MALILEERPGVMIFAKDYGDEDFDDFDDEESEEAIDANDSDGSADYKAEPATKKATLSALKEKRRMNDIVHASTEHELAAAIAAENAELQEYTKEKEARRIAEQKATFENQTIPARPTTALRQRQIREDGTYEKVYFMLVQQQNI